MEHHQATAINWLLSADHSPLETTIAYEQVAIEVTASVAQLEPDPYMAQGFRYALLEDFDHLYRYAALLDRLEGKDANNITQGYTDIVPGRPTLVHHRSPENDLLECYAPDAALATKLHAITLTGGEYQTHDYYMNIGPVFADPVARMLYAEIASVEEQHVTQYECLADPDETWLEKWLLHECNEVYTYWSCLEQETNPRLKRLWDRFVSYELGQMHFVMELMRQIERRDPAELLPRELPDPIKYESQRDFVRSVLASEVDLRANGTEIVPLEGESEASVRYRQQLNSSGSPSELVTTSYQFAPGTELARIAQIVH